MTRKLQTITIQIQKLIKLIKHNQILFNDKLLNFHGDLGISASALTSALASALALQNLLYPCNFFCKIERFCPLHRNTFPCA